MNSDKLSSQTDSDRVSKRWMIEAARDNSPALIEMVKDHPHLASQKDPFTGFTALHWAAKHGNQTMVNVLVESYDVDVNQKSHGGYTALHLAQHYQHTKMCTILVDEFNADANVRDNYGRKPHHYIGKEVQFTKQQYQKREKKLRFVLPHSPKTKTFIPPRLPNPDCSPGLSPNRFSRQSSVPAKYVSSANL